MSKTSANTAPVWAALVLYFLLGLQLLASWIWGRPVWWVAIIAILLTAAFLLRNQRLWIRTGLSLLLAMHLLELLLAVRQRSYTDRMVELEQAIDTRHYFEVYDDERRAGRNSVPAIMPGAAFLESPTKLTINGKPASPMGTFAKRKTILCNECGPWYIYESDEHGFHNPQGIWDKPVDVGFVGDSFTQGTCVDRKDTPAGIVGSEYPQTLNLAMGGNGPLIELAAIKEYFAVVKPKVVIQVLYENDDANLNDEWAYPFLQPYLKQRDYRVGLMDHRPEIEAWLEKVLQKQSSQARRWPSVLSNVGLTRTSTPYWLQDFVMSSDWTGAARVARLHKIFETVSAKLPVGKKQSPVNAPPDGLKLVLKEAKETVESWGGRYYVAYQPGYSGVKGHPAALAFHDRVVETTNALDVPLIDIFPLVTQEPDALSRYFTFAYGHYSNAAYKKAGDAMLQRLKQDKAIR